MSEIRFYLDENVNPVVAEQLVRHGIDAVSVLELNRLGDEDRNHLQWANKMGCVLCTHDTDFLSLNAEGVEHCGIAFAPHYAATIGGWVRALQNLHASTTAEEAIGQVFYLSVK